MNQRTLKILLVALVAILTLALVGQIYINRGLSNKLDLKEAADLMSLQDKCNEQAKKVAYSPNYRTTFTAGTTGYHEYSSHYSPTLRKCFATISTSSDKAGVALSYYISFIDPFENRDYGTYMWLKDSAKGSLYYGDNPHICRMQPSQNDEKKCSSLKEFQTYVAKYME